MEFDEIDGIDVNLLRENMAKAVDSIESKQKKLEEIRAALESARKLVNQLEKEKTTLVTSVGHDRTNIRSMESELAKAQRLEEARKRRAELLKDFNKKSEELDLITAGAPWREWAFEHQITGGKRLAIAKRGILTDKRGLGKTLTSLVWADMVQAKRVLVIAPNDVVPQFEDEIRQWQPHRTIFSLRGLPKGQRDIIYPMLKIVKEFIITLNYEAWRRDKSIIDDLVKAGIDTIICDEAHKIKSSSKITARGVFQIAYRPNYCPRCDVVAAFAGKWEQERVNYKTGLKETLPIDVYEAKCPACSGEVESTVKNVLSMTGTPILNKPQELFSMLFLVDRYRFPSEKTFLNDYCYLAAPNRWRFLSGGLDRLTRTISEFYLGRTREDAGIHIPPPAITIHKIDKDVVNYPKQYKAERDLRNAAALVLESGRAISQLAIIEVIMRERQLMTWPAGINFKIKDEDGNVVEELQFDVEESQKLDAVDDLLSDLLEEEERTIVFSKFKGPLYELKKRHFQDERVVMATGDQADWTRRQIIQDFDFKNQNKPRFYAALATYDAFATGVNLNGARHMILIDDEWNPGMEDQAIGRIDRMNNVDGANVHIFRVKDSIDDFMAHIIEEKKKITEGFDTNISAADLLRHLRGEE